MENVYWGVPGGQELIGFASKFADIEALNRGDAAVLRPVVTEAGRKRVLELPASQREVALVVGGNGFIGAHLVARLSREPSIRKVIATVRASERQSPIARLEETCGAYQITDIEWSKVTVLDASVTKENFGLSDAAYGAIASEVDLVFNCASSCDYTTSYLDLRNDWVLSLLRVLLFSIRGKRKHVTYVGSVGAFLYQSPADFKRPDSWWYSGYCQMKWVNGELMNWLAHEGILSVSLCQTPYVLGATNVGLDPAQHYSWWRIIEIAQNAGYIWRGPGMNYVPVDVLADTLATNALLAEPLRHLLPCNPEPYDNELLAELLGVKLVSWSEFYDEVAWAMSPAYYRAVLSSNFDELVRKTNRQAVFPSGHESSWCKTHELYRLYLRNINFRDLAPKHRPTAAANGALSRA